MDRLLDWANTLAFSAITFILGCSIGARYVIEPKFPMTKISESAHPKDTVGVCFTAPPSKTAQPYCCSIRIGAIKDNSASFEDISVYRR